MRICRNQKSGFSMVELLVVLVIISIMATITYSLLMTHRRQAERRGAAAQIMAIVCAEKNYFYNFRAYRSTTDTANTNALLGISVQDGFFRNYRVTVAGAAFNVSVDAGNAVYRFNTAGNQISCTGSDCV